jgi:hypothetical protein
MQLSIRLEEPIIQNRDSLKKTDTSNICEKTIIEHLEELEDILILENVRSKKEKTYTFKIIFSRNSVKIPGVSLKTAKFFIF